MAERERQKLKIDLKAVEHAQIIQRQAKLREWVCAFKADPSTDQNDRVCADWMTKNEYLSRYPSPEMRYWQIPQHVDILMTRGGSLSWPQCARV